MSILNQIFCLLLSISFARSRNVQKMELERNTLQEIYYKSAKLDNCGLSSTSRRKGRIIDGKKLVDKKFPWVASIQSDKEHICGGTVISTRLVVTAGHCVDTRHSPRMVPEQHEVSVVVGTANLSRLEPDGRRLGVKRIILHPNYQFTTVLLNDIALIELSEEIQFSSHVQPICLPVDLDAGFPLQDTPAVFAGWGITWAGRFVAQLGHVSSEENVDIYFQKKIKLDSSESSFRSYSPSYPSYSDTLNYMEPTIFQNEACNLAYKLFEKKSDVIPPMPLTSSQLCAGYELLPQHSTPVPSNRDSGGPLFFTRQDKGDGVARAILVGVASSTPDNYYAPDKYTRVQSFLRWIISYMDDNSVNSI